MASDMPPPPDRHICMHTRTCMQHTHTINKKNSKDYKAFLISLLSRKFCASQFFYDFWIFVVFDEGKHWYYPFKQKKIILYWEMQNFHPIKFVYLVQDTKSNSKTKNRQESCPSQCVKIAYLVQRHKIINNSWSQCKKIAQVLNKSREKIVHFDLHTTENCISRK